jgi:hypothetical protein
MFTRRILTAGLMLGMLAGPAGAQTVDPAMVEAARKEGTVV